MSSLSAATLFTLMCVKSASSIMSNKKSKEVTHLTHLVRFNIRISAHAPLFLFSRHCQLGYGVSRNFSLRSHADASSHTNELYSKPSGSDSKATRGSPGCLCARFWLVCVRRLDQAGRALFALGLAFVLSRALFESLRLCFVGSNKSSSS